MGVSEGPRGASARRLERELRESPGLWSEEGLRVLPNKRERRRAGDSGLLEAERPDRVWALDYQLDVAASGRKIKTLHMVDEFDRECLADLVDYSIDADAAVACLDKAASAKGRFPENIRCDNGPEFTANALRDWCRFAGTKTKYTGPGLPWQNPWVESYFRFSASAILLRCTKE